MSHVNVKWAERSDKLFITVELSNAKDVKVDFEAQKVTVSGTGQTATSEAHSVSATLNLLKTIVPEQGSYKVFGQYVQVLCIKADKGYWNKLVTEPSNKTKNWLSADWNLWKDEDEEKEDENVNFGGYGDMSNMLNMQNLGGADSDDEEEPAQADLKDLE